MFEISANNCIRITRGDTAAITVDLVDSKSSVYTMTSNDTLTLSVKAMPDDDECLFAITITGNNVIPITTANTKTLDYGTYKYDIELRTTDGGVYTVVPCSNFIICQEVG